MTRTWIITCIKGSDTSLLPRPYLPSLIFTMYALLLIVFPAPLSHAEEAKVFTDADLANYKSEPMVDQETAARMNDDLKSYERKRDADWAALQRQKQGTAMSAATGSRQGKGNASGAGNKRKT